MHYLYKLKFPYGVHFGADKIGIGLEKISMNCHCDTFYSALCQEILKLYGEEELNAFVANTKNGEYLFSDLLPYTENDLLIPKPILFSEQNEDKQTDEVTASVKKKQMKKLQFIPISKIKEYFDKNVETVDFAENMLYDKCSPSRTGEKENGLYSVAITRFEKNCGLYFVANLPEEKKEWFDKVLESLSLSGIGGKRTSGYGQFEVKTSPIQSELAKALKNDGEYYLSLSAFVPKKEEIPKLQQGYYTLIKRQGFVSSTNYSDTQLKKTPLTMVNAGSCFKEKFTGDIVDVSNQGNHPVYRYGKPIMIGINQ